MRKSMLSAYLIIVLCLLSIFGAVVQASAESKGLSAGCQITFNVLPTATLKILNFNKSTVTIKVTANTSWTLSSFSNKSGQVVITGTKTGNKGKQFKLDKNLAYTVVCP